MNGNVGLSVKRNTGVHEFYGARNGVTDQGLRYLMTQMFASPYRSAGVAVPTYVGLISGVGFTDVSASDTLSSHTGWTEITTGWGYYLDDPFYGNVTTAVFTGLRASNPGGQTSSAERYTDISSYHNHTQLATPDLALLVEAYIHPFQTLAVRGIFLTNSRTLGSTEAKHLTFATTDGALFATAVFSSTIFLGPGDLAVIYHFTRLVSAVAP